MDKAIIELLDELSDDYFGLWEVGVNIDNLNSPEVRGRMDLIIELTKSGMLNLFYGNPGMSELKLIDAAGAAYLLKDAAIWVARESVNDPAYFLVTSDAGLRIVQEELSGGGKDPL